METNNRRKRSRITYSRCGGADGPDDEILAAEYVLHLLDPADRAAAEARLEVDGAFRARAAGWSERLIPLVAEIPPVAPPTRIRAALDDFAKAQVAGPAPRVGSRAAGARSFGANVLRGFLGGVAALGLAAAVVLVAMPVLRPAYDGPQYAAEIAAEDGSLLLRASFDPSRNTLTVSRTAGDVLPDRVQQLWLIAPGVDVPISIGILPDDGSVARVTLPEELAERVPAGTLAVSDEPPGGSPGPGPSGAVLAVGPVSEI